MLVCARCCFSLSSLTKKEDFNPVVSSWGAAVHSTCGQFLVSLLSRKTLLARNYCRLPFTATVPSSLLGRYLVHHRISHRSPHDLCNAKECSISLCQSKRKRQAKNLKFVLSDWTGETFTFNIKIQKTLIFQGESWKRKWREMLEISILPYGILSTLIYWIWSTINSF